MTAPYGHSETFQLRVTKLLADSGMSFPDLAKRAGIADRTARRWASGAAPHIGSPRTSKQLKAFAKALKAPSVSWLYGLDDEGDSNASRAEDE